MYTCSVPGFKSLASFCSRAGWFEAYLFENPQRHIFAWCGSIVKGCFQEWLQRKVSFRFYVRKMHDTLCSILMALLCVVVVSNYVEFYTYLPEWLLRSFRDYRIEPRHWHTVMILSFRTDRPGQTVQTQIRLLLEEQSDQGLHCLPFRLHRWDSLLYRRATLFNL